MFKFIKIYTCAIFILASTWSISQSQCPDPSQILKADYKDGWGENSQSKTGALRPGDSYEINFIAHGGMKYRITIMSGVSDFTDENVEFQLVGSEVNKVKENGRSIYKRQEVVFFDSEKLSEDEKMSFSTDKTRKLKLKMKLNGVEESKLVQCVVVFVEHKKEIETGF
ncbi:MAG: hypothetical protein WED10_06485 [Brumimicrobium sp.]